MEFSTLASQITPWFDNPGLVGAIVGTGVGVLGAVLGTACGICAPRGIARSFVIGLDCGLIVIGIALLATGFVALAGGQPYGVWYGFLLPGLLLTIITGALLPVIIRTYRLAEARHLEAEEFRTA